MTMNNSQKIRGGIGIFKAIRITIIALALISQCSSALSQNPLPFRIGLNFAFVGGSNTPVSTYVSQLGELGVHATRQMTQADTTWSNLQTNSAVPPNFANADQIFFNTNGTYPVGDLYEPSGNGLQVPWYACSNSNNPLCGFSFTRDTGDASNYVTTVVSRYKTASHFWEIGNEMDGKQARPSGMPPAEFAQFLITNRNWIRAADPQAQVVLPGCLGGTSYPLTNAYTWLRTVLSNGGAAGFDVMNYHDYKSWWVLPADFDGYRAVLSEFNLTNMPIWISECSSASVSGNPQTVVPYASEDQQAADVWRRSCVLFGKGATAWCWHSLYSGPSGSFANQGLLTPTTGTPAGQKKKSWHSFKLLCANIENFQTAKLIALGNVTTNNSSGGDGQWAVQFDWADGTRRFVVWSGTNLNFTLTNLTASPYRITTVVPATISTNGETATFTITTNTPAAGSLNLTGTNLPVLVESIVLPSPVITNTLMAGNIFTISGTGPTAQAYRVFAATNVALAFSNWTQVSSGSFTGGVFQFSDSFTTNFPQRFYRLSVP